jgi:transposase
MDRKGEPDSLHYRRPESVKSAEKGGAASIWVALMRAKRRHVLVDTFGLASVHPADVQDRDGGALLLSTLFGPHPFLQKLFAGGGYQGPQFHKAQKKVLPHLSTEISERFDQAKGFEVLPRRWVAERMFACCSRRLAKDFENLARNALAIIRLASIRFRCQLSHGMHIPKLKR